MQADAIEIVYFKRLWELMPVHEPNATGPEVSAIRDLYCAVDQETRRYGTESVLASAADAARRHAARRAVQEAMAEARTSAMSAADGSVWGYGRSDGEGRYL
ncbi:hypothetical protein GCM10010191_17120 [Actinomadura vinacea]|uniref:Uncharacterized protein n=1 Tax=Actinomadura vinacea TaxID=115336 RepID=A0ABN3IN84_9ACTN